MKCSISTYYKILDAELYDFDDGYMREIDLLGATHWHLLIAKGGSYAKTGGLVNRR